MLCSSRQSRRLLQQKQNHYATLQWTLKGEDLINFIRAQPGTAFLPAPINYHQLTFQSRVYPNGFSRDEEGFGSIHFGVTQIPAHILQLYVLCTVYLENKCIIQESFLLDHNYPFVMLTSKDIASFDISDHIDSEKLTFLMRVNVMDFVLAPKQGEERMDLGIWRESHHYYFTPIMMPVVQSHHWKLEEWALREMRHSKLSLCYADSPPDNNWTFCIQSNGTDCSLALKLLRFPRGISKLDIRVQFTLTYDHEGDQTVSILDVRNLERFGARQLNYKLRDWSTRKMSVTAINAKVDIYVLRAFGPDGKLIFSQDLRNC